MALENVQGSPERIKQSSRFIGQIVVVLVLTSIASITLLATIVAATFKNSNAGKTLRVFSIDRFKIYISGERPPSRLVLYAVIAIVAIAACALIFETLAALLSISPKRRTLGLLRTRTDVLRNASGKVRVTVLVPAHNEEDRIRATVEALHLQTRKPDRVIVVADNCSDTTVEIAESLGAITYETIDNEHKKGGALNQILAVLLPLVKSNEVFLIMDADTSLGPRFIEVATQHLEKDPELAAVGGVFLGEAGHGLVGQFQRNEYARYGVQIKARKGRVFVLTGTATMFRGEALLDVAAARGIYIPGEAGKVYDTTALTEDNELTLALKSLGATMISPSECTVVTELMPTWRNLWIQRLRWQRGALENLGAYGMTRATIRYWGQQFGIGYGAIALNSSIALAIITLFSLDRFIWFPFWSSVGAIFVIERVITVWRNGRKGVLLAVLLIPELLYDVFLQIVFFNALFKITLGQVAHWGHVQSKAVAP